jgi:hypothetical protein
MLRRHHSEVLRQRQALELLRLRRLVLRGPLLPTGQAVPVRPVPLPARQDDLRARVLQRHGEVLRRSLLPQGEDVLWREVL